MSEFKVGNELICIKPLDDAFTLDNGYLCEKEDIGSGQKVLFVTGDDDGYYDPNDYPDHFDYEASKEITELPRSSL